MLIIRCTIDLNILKNGFLELSLFDISHPKVMISAKQKYSENKAGFDIPFLKQTKAVIGSCIHT